MARRDVSPLDPRIPHLEFNSYLYGASFEADRQRESELSIERKIIEKEIAARSSRCISERTLREQLTELDREIERQLLKARAAEVESEVRHRLEVHSLQRSRASPQRSKTRSRLAPPAHQRTSSGTSTEASAVLKPRKSSAKSRTKRSRHSEAVQLYTELWRVASRHADDCPSLQADLLQIYSRFRHLLSSKSC